tara:strand:+ start:15136 stop:15345 length:210 start_codon:yes stop_codon:yes gene_type:complete
LNRSTRHQVIWVRDKETVTLNLPKTIKSDIGFQLMFGEREDYRTERLKLDNYSKKKHLTIYEDKEYYYN